MPAYIDIHDRLHDDQAASLALTCPHCSVLAHITPLAVPGFAELSASRPRQIGVVYRCDACNSPIFLRFSARSYGIERIELSSQFSEVERAVEKFKLTYLPQEIEFLFREALQCFSHGLFNSFASMCRRTMQAVFADLGESGKLRVFADLNDVRDMAEIEGGMFTPIKRVLFGSDADVAPSLPLLEEEQAGLLLEVIKDLLYQSYVRKRRLQQAMVVRRIGTGRSESGSAQPLGTEAGT